MAVKRSTQQSVEVLRQEVVGTIDISPEGTADVLTEFGSLVIHDARDFIREDKTSKSVYSMSPEGLGTIQLTVEHTPDGFDQEYTVDQLKQMLADARRRERKSDPLHGEEPTY